MSCTQEEELEVYKAPLTEYNQEIISYINEVYDFCLTFYEEDIPQYLIYNPADTSQKIEVIKYCDLLDESGDVFVGWDSYDMIKNILWPNGYGNE